MSFVFKYVKINITLINKNVRKAACPHHRAHRFKRYSMFYFWGGVNKKKHIKASTLKIIRKQTFVRCTTLSNDSVTITLQGNLIKRIIIKKMRMQKWCLPCNCMLNIAKLLNGGSKIKIAGTVSPEKNKTRLQTKVIDRYKKVIWQERTTNLTTN